MRWLSRLWLTVAIAAGFATCSVKATETEEVERYLFASVHRFASFHAKQGRTNFHDETEQGVFVYDINDGHKLVEKFPAKLWKSWSGGWAGVGAHAGTGVFFQVQDRSIPGADFEVSRGDGRRGIAVGLDGDLPGLGSPGRWASVLHTLANTVRPT